MPKEDSRHELNVDLREKQRLALNQAINSLRESLANARATDTKLYGIIALTTTLLVLLVTVNRWSSKSNYGMLLSVMAFVTFLVVIGLGLKAYFPTELFDFDARAITENMEEPYEDLVRWTLDCVLDCADSNYRAVDRKQEIVSIMLIIFLISTGFLIIGALLN